MLHLANCNETPCYPISISPGIRYAYILHQRVFNEMFIHIVIYIFVYLHKNARHAKPLFNDANTDLFVYTIKGIQLS